MADFILARRLIRLKVAQALATLQGVTIDSPGDSSMPSASLPAVLWHVKHSQKEQIAVGPMNFVTSVYVSLETQVKAPKSDECQVALEDLDLRVELALFTHAGLVRATQKTHAETESNVKSDGRSHFGATTWLIRFDLPEVYDPVIDAPPAYQPVAVPLAELNLQTDAVDKVTLSISF
jgi:hypothetical protein